MRLILRYQTLKGVINDVDDTILENSEEDHDHIDRMDVSLKKDDSNLYDNLTQLLLEFALFIRGPYLKSCIEILPRISETLCDTISFSFQKRHGVDTYV